MKLSMVEKAKLTRRNAEISKELKKPDIRFSAKAKLMKEKSSNRAKLGKGKSAASNDVPPISPQPAMFESDLPARFAGGEFDHLPIVDFMVKMDEAEEAGAVIEQLRKGTEAWTLNNQAIAA